MVPTSGGLPGTEMARHGTVAVVLLLAVVTRSVPGVGDEGPPAFVERAAETGLDFVHFNGMSGELYFVEMMGGGGALLDYDNDGDLDVYLGQGHMLGPGKTPGDATFPPRHPLPLTDRLYRNDLALDGDGAPVLRFTDVTARAGLEVARGYATGVASGDFDNDGWTDLYVAGYGPNLLLRNRGDGSFEDVTAASGTDDRRWSAAATFFDYDRDGWLDLFVVNYVDFSLVPRRECHSEGGGLDYCGPLAFDPETDRLFRNRGDGTFEDATVAAGIHRSPGSGLGVVSADFDRDGWLDLYVANDQAPNFLWMNQGNGTFVEDALLAGCAVNWEGQAEASMGVSAADFDWDGDEDLFMTHLTRETNTLYRNDGRGIFRDESRGSGLDNPSWAFTAFGALWLDYDNDGALDLLAVSGAVKTIESLAREEDPFPLRQTNQLFRNLGDGTWTEATAEAGPAFELAEVSRGAAGGDVDNDGDTDVAVVNNAGPVRLLINQVGQTRGWVGARVLTGRDGRNALGAWTGLSAGRVEGARWQRVRSDGSYASAGDPRLLWGLGSTPPEALGLQVEWTDGSRTAWDDLPPQRYLVLPAPAPSSPR